MEKLTRKQIIQTIIDDLRCARVMIADTQAVIEDLINNELDSDTKNLYRLIDESLQRSWQELYDSAFDITKSYRYDGNVEDI